MMETVDEQLEATSSTMTAAGERERLSSIRKLSHRVSNQLGAAHMSNCITAGDKPRAPLPYHHPSATEHHHHTTVGPTQPGASAAEFTVRRGGWLEVVWRRDRSKLDKGCLDRSL